MAIKAFGFGHIRADLAQSKLDVALCDRRVSLKHKMGGFARAAGAAALPAALVRQTKGMRMIQSPAMRLSWNGTAKHEDSSPELCNTTIGTLRELAERLASAGGRKAAAAANRIAGAEVC